MRRAAVQNRWPLRSSAAPRPQPSLVPPIPNFSPITIFSLDGQHGRKICAPASSKQPLPTLSPDPTGCTAVCDHTSLYSGNLLHSPPRQHACENFQLEAQGATSTGAITGACSIMSSNLPKKPASSSSSGSAEPCLPISARNLQAPRVALVKADPYPCNLG